MAVAVWTSFQQIANSSGTPYSGALVNVYAAGTTTPLSVFSDSALGVAAANPIVCDSSGQHAMRYIATASYKTTVTDASLNPLTNWSKDNIDPGVAVGSGALPIANGGTGATTAGAARTALGVPASATVTAIASDVTTLQSYHTGTSASKTANGTTAQRSGSPADFDVRGNTTIQSLETYLGGTWHKISFAPPVVAAQKLSIANNAGTPNSKIDLTADAVTIVDTNNAAVRLTSVSLTIDCGTVGANGIDAGSLANSTWYHVFVIFNPATGTTAGLMSASATSPTMPSGYTFKGMFGEYITNASAQFHRISHKGRRAQYVVSASVTTALPTIASGTQGTYSATTPTWATPSITTVVPPTAVEIAVTIANAIAAGTPRDMQLAPSSTYSGAGTANPCLTTLRNADSITSVTQQFVLEGTTIAVTCSGTDGAFFCLGWVKNL